MEGVTWWVHGWLLAFTGLPLFCDWSSEPFTTAAVSATVSAAVIVTVSGIVRAPVIAIVRVTVTFRIANWSTCWCARW